ncbi:hypothetical protein M896_120890 [Ordospora colligata OC4]|uniref:RING-type domain-containing protein n=1 Tax=Ordospora colligata OC4 TaxID=1354746 RepID=A0A0B2UIJ5_9MICR|nr:uncharacterized protein M896_120890 [Ordospora colligata OC4]KHN68867.1 hypothetical protein M896_120890 [Ordospora colligata OC4]TBU13901.1 hypothetical protein CWI40_120890 [Ordospora colligata]TBU14090.1 hypothetical protein CWI41_120890 [Ordospora colligata]
MHALTQMNKVFADDEYLIRILNDLFDVEEYGCVRSVSHATDEQESVICSVCLDATVDKFVFLTCGHRFHSKCIEMWLQARKNCPYCRQMVNS